MSQSNRWSNLKPHYCRSKQHNYKHVTKNIKKLKRVNKAGKSASKMIAIFIEKV